MTTAELPDPWAAVPGQDEATARLEAAAESPVHAYMFLGAPGGGSYRAALGFAALLLSAAAESGGDLKGAERHRDLALRAAHPDLVIIEATGTALSVDDAKEIIRQASTSPVEGDRKVIVVRSIEIITEAAIGKLLKIIEEPSKSAIFVLLAEVVPPEIVTIFSRCVPVEFSPISLQVIESALFADGVPPARAKAAAAAAGGDLDRARLLATDDSLADRAALWRTLPQRLNGSGSAVVEMVSQVRESIDAALEPLEVQHLKQIEDLEARVELTGERGSGRSELIARQKREARKVRSDELRFGLATLARFYRDVLIDGPDPAAERAVAAIQRTVESLIRNPNEALQLQALFLELGATSSAD